jgi:hypothetical protein
MTGKRRRLAKVPVFEVPSRGEGSVRISDDGEVRLELPDRFAIESFFPGWKSADSMNITFVASGRHVCPRLRPVRRPLVGGFVPPASIRFNTIRGRLLARVVPGSPLAVFAGDAEHVSGGRHDPCRELVACD